MGALFLHLKPDEYLKKLYKTKKLVEKTLFSLQAELPLGSFFYFESIISVTGPEFVSCTSIIAPNVPVSTLIPFSRSRSFHFS
nr:hypothetical protein NRS6120_00693 [Bacillus subtilis]